MGWPGPMTHRQFRAWRAWLDMQWDRPSRTDHYIMQATAESIRPHVKKGTKVKTSDYRLSFSPDGKRKATPVQSPEENRAAWLGIAAGLKGAKYTPGPGTSATGGG